MEQHIKYIVDQVKPDILHVFGTEYPHSLVAARTFNNPEKCVINIQGLTSVIWIHNMSGVTN